LVVVALVEERRLAVERLAVIALGGAVVASDHLVVSRGLAPSESVERPLSR
jgi:hypothetical protein